MAKPKTPAKPKASPPVQHDRRGHNGSTRGRKDMAGRKHSGPSIPLKY